MTLTAYYILLQDIYYRKTHIMHVELLHDY